MPGMAALAMRSALLFSSKWLPATDFVARHGFWRLTLVALPHIVALAMMVGARPVTAWRHSC